MALPMLAVEGLPWTRTGVLYFVPVDGNTVVALCDMLVRPVPIPMWDFDRVGQKQQI